MFRIVRSRVRARRVARRMLKPSATLPRVSVEERRPARSRMPVLIPAVALALVAAAVTYRFQLGVADAVWSMLASPLVASLWTGLFLTVAICGTVAYGVVEWACRRPTQVSGVSRDAAGQSNAANSTRVARSRHAA